MNNKDKQLEELNGFQADNDPDEWVDDEDLNEIIIGYECLGCGNTQPSNGWGGRCDRCDGLTLEPMYY